MKPTPLKKFALTDEHPGAGSGSWLQCNGNLLSNVSPIDGGELSRIRCADRHTYRQVVRKAVEAFIIWREVPAPARGDIVRQIGNALRKAKKDLGALVTLEMGKILTEGEGEVQEMIDIADFAVGQSRMLYGLTMPSERKGHRMFEQWHPLGPIGVITSFNFPVAVWAWNAMLALVAGNTVIWKPSSKTPLTAIATMKIVWQVLHKNGLPEGLLNLVIGDRGEVGRPLIEDHRLPLISATGSVEMGRKVGQAVAARLGRSLLELGGNNGVIVSPDADVDLAVQAIVFGAVGTAGQRCTSTRRAIVHRSILKPFTTSLVTAYKQVPIGDPMDKNILMGPLVDRKAVDAMGAALDLLKAQGGRTLYGGQVLSGPDYAAGTYVVPCICEASPEMPIVKEETFAPILYVMAYDDINEAIANHNSVPQGLASAIFSNNLKETELFLSDHGSDCGLACVNTGTSGAEIGGAFGGEKETGGGRESGSDAWKSYMRRQTCTLNWSGKLPLAQGIAFDTQMAETSIAGIGAGPRYDS